MKGSDSVFVELTCAGSGRKMLLDATGVYILDEHMRPYSSDGSRDTYITFVGSSERIGVKESAAEVAKKLEDARNEMNLRHARTLHAFFDLRDISVKVNP